MVAMDTLAAVLLISSLCKAEREATAVLRPNPEESTSRAAGTIRFVEADGSLRVTGVLSNVLPGSAKHGFHIHLLGDLSTGCSSAKGHYNPRNVNHGDKAADQRHVGDLGNLDVDPNGRVNVDLKFDVNDLPLTGRDSIVGRMLVLHEGEDDLGKGTGPAREGSLANGNAGKRLACGVIGYASEFDVAGSTRAGTALLVIAAIVFILLVRF